MVKMTDEEWMRFVLEKPRPAIAAVARPDGRPHATPVWVDMDGEQLVFTTWHESVKGKALRGNPRVALVIQDDNPPFSFVVIEGTVSLSEEPAELQYWAGRLGGRYMGADRAEAYAARNGVPGELLIRVTPQHVTAERDIAV